MSKRKLTVQIYKQLFELYESGYSMEYALEQSKVDYSPRKLVNDYFKYQKHGEAALLPKVKNRSYSESFKQQVINEYLNDGVSYNELLIKYNIPSTSTINRWISQYLSGKIIKNYSPKPEVYQLKYKSLSYEERIEIVNHYMNHTQSYKETANHFNVNYNQIYNWIQKYKKHGYDGLKDGRGKGKPKSVLTTEEALRAENKILKERNKYLQMENDVLKKEEVIERQLMNQELDKRRHIKR